MWGRTSIALCATSNVAKLIWRISTCKQVSLPQPSPLPLTYYRNLSSYSLVTTLILPRFSRYNSLCMVIRYVLPSRWSDLTIMQVLELDPTSATAHFNLAILFHKHLQNFPRALKHFDMAIHHGMTSVEFR